jgi:hypothetical protein
MKQMLMVGRRRFLASLGAFGGAASGLLAGCGGGDDLRNSYRMTPLVANRASYGARYTEPRFVNGLRQGLSGGGRRAGRGRRLDAFVEAASKAIQNQTHSRSDPARACIGSAVGCGSTIARQQRLRRR